MELQVSNTFAPTAGTLGVEDRVTVYGWQALAGSVIGYAMDGFDMLILSFMLAAISADLALTSTQAGSLVTWTLLGAVAGGLLFGTLSDHCGRIQVLTWTILLFAGCTGVCPERSRAESKGLLAMTGSDFLHKVLTMGITLPVRCSAKVIP
jgi:MFS family permease